MSELKRRARYTLEYSEFILILCTNLIKPTPAARLHRSASHAKQSPEQP